MRDKTFFSWPNSLWRPFIKTLIQHGHKILRLYRKWLWNISKCDKSIKHDKHMINVWCFLQYELYLNNFLHLSKIIYHKLNYFLMFRCFDAYSANFAKSPIANMPQAISLIFRTRCVDTACTYAREWPGNWQIRTNWRFFANTDVREYIFTQLRV